MKILFKDKKDISSKLINEMKDSFFVGGRDTLTPEMKDCDVLSVNTSIVDNKILREMPNLKWVINRSQNPDNINLKHCREKNIGVINMNYSQKPITKWVEGVINKEYCLPYYTVFTESNIGKLLNDKFEYVKELDLESSDQKIFTTLSETNTLIISLPLTNKTRCMINREISSFLPLDATIINVGDGKVINNKDLLGAINEGRVRHVTADNLDSNYRQDLVETGCVNYTKNKGWKSSTNIKNLTTLIKKNVKALEADNPINVILERVDTEVEVFWD